MGYYVGNSRKSIFHFKRTADIFFSAAARCIIRIVQFNIFMQKKGQKVNHSWLFITITGPVSVWLHVHILRLMWVYLCRSRGSHWAIQSQGQWIRFAAKRKAGEWSMEHERIDARAEERERLPTPIYLDLSRNHIQYPLTAKRRYCRINSEDRWLKSTGMCSQYIVAGGCSRLGECRRITQREMVLACTVCAFV